ncbi:MAG TPA: DUF1684 domain-containing protein [Muricauda sp.]|uniref:DUF1684 domain-containing protein n=1 Tax=Flagellimonas aurea TaxID=2915619 RepID=A0ABS3G389_9FLAO|nr:DUF1684 domain-containing protein [Allomuricauda aurea]MAO17169.1 hypothetical protein [Allomuricauda sp.]MBO0353773.1 DUF1684 domain-containing protein [Allomuricauda aurea]HBU78388.1 DUF1684 domain-containing protein [Allomuricauda sp.]|tara:strand:- start:1381 stop:2019 length:639 start_codon:yes stop_codon:yes gene_type:complete
MKYAIVLSVVFLMACGQGKKYHDEGKSVTPKSDLVADILDYQKKQNESFRDPDSSPLPDKYRKDFEGLDFFEPDTNYIVKAHFVRTPDAEPFLMPTTTDRQTQEVVYGIAHFNLNGEEHQLEVYQSLGLMDDEEYEEYLFLPFLDNTNGEETYGGGRYIDLTIPEGDTLIIDFNKAYNPYCVYNKKYSCPLVPRQNYLRTKVRAGVKNFNKD